jgi:GT2 family glycosyltransferase
MLYGDEDWPANHRWERQPWFKPDWNAELFLGLDYLSSLIVVRRDVLGEILDQGNDGSTFDDLLLRLTGMVSPDIAHLPSVLSHVGTACPPKAARLRAVAGHLDGRAECRPGPFDTVHVQWPLPSPPPLATIIIPTRDKIELLRACVESIFEKTDYAAYEIIIVDNGSRENATLAYLEQLTRDPNVRVIRSDAEYNFSALNNLAVRAAAGSFVLLLNNDTEVISPEWLSELMRQAVREEVGAVGAKLLYEDDSIQHAGVVVGMGEAAGHAHRFLASHDPGYFWQAHVAQFVTANTAACLLVRRDKFEAVGGLDEEGLAIAYNDVDLCLKLERAGWRNVYTPHALLYHHESKSRGNDLSPEHRDRYMRELKVFQERWGTRTYLDPQHSPNLDRYSESYVTNFY